MVVFASFSDDDVCLCQCQRRCHRVGVFANFSDDVVVWVWVPVSETMLQGGWVCQCQGGCLGVGGCAGFSSDAVVCVPASVTML